MRALGSTGGNTVMAPFCVALMTLMVVLVMSEIACKVIAFPSEVSLDMVAKKVSIDKTPPFCLAFAALSRLAIRKGVK